MSDSFKSAVLLFEEREYNSESNGAARQYLLDDALLEALSPATSILLDVETLTLSNGTARAELEMLTSSIADRAPRHNGAVVQLQEAGQSPANKLTVQTVGTRRVDSIGTLRARTEVVLRVFDSNASPVEVRARLRVWATVKG